MLHDPRKVDLRIRRTRRALRDALLALIEEKGFDAIEQRPCHGHPPPSLRLSQIGIALAAT